MGQESSVEQSVYFRLGQTIIYLFQELSFYRPHYGLERCSLDTNTLGYTEEI